MKVVLFAGDDIAIPAYFELLEKEFLSGVVMTRLPSSVNLQMHSIVCDSNIPHTFVDRKALHEELPDWLLKIKPEAIFVITFSFKIPEKILKIPKFGCFNWHIGVLPNYRGPDAVFWEFVKGEKEGGVTLHRMSKEFDAGSIIKVERIPIDKGQTYGEHHSIARDKVLEMVRYMVSMLVVDPGEIEDRPQDEKQAGYFKSPGIKDLLIDWDSFTAGRIERLVQAANPTYGGAITSIRGCPLCIYQVSILDGDADKSVRPGTVIGVDLENGLVVKSSDGYPVRIDIISCGDGFYDGARLVERFGIKCGEEFQKPKISA